MGAGEVLEESLRRVWKGLEETLKRLWEFWRGFEEIADMSDKRSGILLRDTL
ncbi:hypothetical protein CDPAHKCJ_00820 [Cobetia sp. MB87]|nr:hypothetical protein [Cobetia sp. MB87]